MLGCERHEPEEVVARGIEFSLDRKAQFTLAPPIPADDQWLASFKTGHDYDQGWETWVWRKTDLKVGEGITVYARNQDEQHFLLRGIPELDQITVDFRAQVVGEAWSFGATHVGSLTPSENYVVVITSYPRTYLPNGMSLKERYKTDRGWDFEFVNDKVSWWIRRVTK